MTRIYITWTEFKGFIDTDVIQWQFNEVSGRYDVFGIQGPATYICNIPIDGGADQLDFEQNYKNNPTPIIRTIFEGSNKNKLESFNGNGFGVFRGDGTAIKAFSMQVSAVGGTPLSWNVVLLGSLDGVNFDTILVHTERDGLKKIVSTGSTNKFVGFYKIEVQSLTLNGATSINVAVLEVK